MTEKTELQSRLLRESKVFCTLPWSNLNIAVNGDVFPCHMAPYSDLPMGSVKKSTLENLWNSERMRKLRKNMIEGRKSPECSECYKLEEAGIESARISHNLYHEKRGNPSILDKTGEDGAVTDFSPYKISIQFSNLCYSRCRYCHPGASSGWYNDAVLLGQHPAHPRLIQVTEDPKTMLRQIEALLPVLREIFFYGGEPLIMEEPYAVMRMLLEQKRFDFHLAYSTNFGAVHRQEMDIFEAWKKFERVQVFASLDAMGARAEYIRKGQKWSQVVKNRERMLKVCPNVRFVVHPLMTVFNAWHFPDFYMDWVDRGYLEPQEIDISFAIYPLEYSIQILPADFKRRIAEKYERCIQDISRRYGDAGARAAEILRGVPRFLEDKDMSGQIPLFRERTRKLDHIRRENCAEVFPELAEILE